MPALLCKVSAELQPDFAYRKRDRYSSSDLFRHFYPLELKRDEIEEDLVILSEHILLNRHAEFEQPQK
eukprot:3601579-Pyramimonas_sp.AAC.1